MIQLETQIRHNLDAIAPPITLNEIHRAETVNHRQPMPWPRVGVAASILVVAGVAGLVLLTSGRDSPAPQVEPVVTPAAQTTTIPVTVPVKMIDVVVPAGLTVGQVGELLSDTIATIDAEEFITAANGLAATSIFAPEGVASAEGLLAPGRYTIAETDTVADVAAQMIAAMNESGSTAAMEARGAALGRSPYEVLIIASIVEKEANVGSDRDAISRIIHNRLFITETNPGNPFPLQVDAAVLYGRDQLDLDSDLPFSQLRQIPSDWNTYIIPGLPITPITNPSAEAINAALNPRPNPEPNDPLCVDLPNPDECFLFFFVLADEDGSLNFAATFEQHEANVEEARQANLL